MARARCSPHALLLFGAVSRASSLHAIDRAKCAELTRRARDFVTTEASTTSFPRATNATRAVISRVNAT